MPRFTLVLFVFALWSRPAVADDGVLVTLRLNVAGVRLMLDGADVEGAFADGAFLRVAAGPHALTLLKEGFKPVEQRFDAVPPAVELSFALLPEAPVKAVGVRRIAVQELVSDGVAPRTLAFTGEALLAEVRKLDRVSAIGLNEVREMLSFEQQRQLLGCDAESCLAEIGGALGVDELVSGQVGRVADSSVFTLRRIDLVSAQVKGSVSRRFPVGNGEEFLAAVGAAIAELYPDVPLKPGRTRGVPKEAALRLNPPPIPRWGFFATAGVAGAGLLAGALLGANAVQAQGRFDAVVARSLQEVVPNRELSAAAADVRGAADAATAAWAIAAVLVVAAGFEAPFTDWADDAGAGSLLVLVVPSPSGALVAGRF